MAYKDPEKRREYQREYCKRNREKLRESAHRRQREYRERNREKRREYQREYCKRNREKLRESVREHQRKYRERNREKLREYAREYHERNREKSREYAREYRERNREKIEWNKRNPEKCNAGNRRRRKDLASAYIRGLLSADTRVPHSQWPPDIVELKRAHVMLTRRITRIQKQERE